MKIAYLITAHCDSKALAKLVDSLMNYDSEAVAIVHVDQKANIEPFAFACNKYSRCSFLKRRNRVSWGGFSILKVQIELLREAITSANSEIRRFVFLSGLDFPIASPARINAFFTEHPDTEFVGGANISSCRIDSAVWRVNRFHAFRDSHLPKQVKRVVTKLVRDGLSAVGIRKSTRPLLSGKRVDVFFGGEQFAITRRFAERALNDYDRDTVFREYFRTTFSPAEMFWQTILYNSEFKPGRFDWNDAHVSDLSKLTPLHFLSYQNQIKVMELKDLDELLNSGRLFFRKAVSGISDDLISSLENSWQTKESKNEPDFHNREQA